MTMLPLETRLTLPKTYGYSDMSGNYLISSSELRFEQGAVYGRLTVNRIQEVTRGWFKKKEIVWDEILSTEPVPIARQDWNDINNPNGIFEDKVRRLLPENWQGPDVQTLFFRMHQHYQLLLR